MVTYIYIVYSGGLVVRDIEVVLQGMYCSTLSVIVGRHNVDVADDRTKLMPQCCFSGQHRAFLQKHTHTNRENTDVLHKRGMTNT